MNKSFVCVAEEKVLSISWRLKKNVGRFVVRVKIVVWPSQKTHQPEIQIVLSHVLSITSMNKEQTKPDIGEKLSDKHTQPAIILRTIKKFTDFYEITMS